MSRIFDMEIMRFDLNEMVFSNYKAAFEGKRHLRTKTIFLKEDDIFEAKRQSKTKTLLLTALRLFSFIYFFLSFLELSDMGSIEKRPIPYHTIKSSIFTTKMCYS